MAKISGVVTSVRVSHNQRDNIYNVIRSLSGTVNAGVVRIKSDIILKTMEIIEAEEVSRDGEGVVSCSVTVQGRISKEDYGSLSDAMVSGIGLHEPDISGFQSHLVSMMERCLPDLKYAAALLIRNMVSGSPISIHFHADGDGSSGAIALYRAMKMVYASIGGSEAGVRWSSTRGISYNDELFYIDQMLIGSYESAERPIVLVTDFGSTSESNGYMAKISEMADLIWIDHHPPDKRFDSKLIRCNTNPWNNGGSSSLTAGFMTSVLAEMICGNSMSDMMHVSLISDHSEYAKPDSKFDEISIVLEAMNTYHESYKSPTPQSFESVMRDKERFSSIYNEYTEQMESSISIGKSKSKRYKSSKGFTIYALDFEKIAKMNFNYIKLGRYTSELHSAIERDSPESITLVYYKKYVSIRASRSVAAESILLNLINHLIEKNDDVEGGGGHKEAVSVKIASGEIKDVVVDIISYLGGKSESANP